MDKKSVCKEIFNRLMSELPSYWDGKETVLFMRDNGCRNWRQMEWPGWYFQFMCETVLGRENFFTIPGPSYGKVKFDGERIIPWDFKAHAGNGSSKSYVPTNGYRAVKSAIDDYGCVGFIVASGNAFFDDDEQTFKKWHDALKGKTSNYEKARIARGAHSRRRKVSFELESVRFIFVDKDTLKYCGSFQSGMRNSDGTPRNSKVMIDITQQRLEQYIFNV